MLASRTLGAIRMTETRPGVIIVAESGSGPYSQLVHAGRHILSADESEASGGDDVGPSPYEYLLAGLGACTAMTLRFYVDRHNWGLRQTTVELWHEKRPTPDGKSMIDHFHRAIHLDGDLTEEQRLRLLDIAERCPVSQTLRRSSAIDSRLADASQPIAASGRREESNRTVTRKDRL
jgi:putative redox protein